MWDGDLASLGDQPLLVWAEQGYGDNVQFVRYVQILIEAGVKVTLSARNPYYGCLRNVFSHILL